MRVLVSAALLALALAPAARGAGIEVRVAHESRPEAAREVHVRLLGLTAQREPFTLEGRTDSAGVLRFEDVRTPAAYIATAEFAGATFSGDGVVTFDPEQDPAGAIKAIAVSIHDPSHDASAVRLESLRWVLNYEAGAYEIRQAAMLRNDGERTVVLDPEAPAPVRIALAPGHGGLRTPTGLPPPDFVLRDGRMDLRGPIAPGPRELILSYEIVSESGDLDSELYFPVETPSFDLYVRDRGVVIDAGPLHPARPARAENGAIYQRYLGFDLAAGTRIPLRVRVLPERSSGSTPLVALPAALLGLLLVIFVGRPVVSVARPGREGHEDAESAEKEALFAALRDLEHDFETGKLSSGDRDRLRDELRREALDAIARVRRIQARDDASPRVCECGRELARGDRFCSGCGREL